MSAALTALVEAETALVAALDGDDCDFLNEAVAGLETAVAGLSAIGAWRVDPAARDILAHALKLAEAARVRINYHADRNRQRIDLLAAIAGQARTRAYTRRGVLAG